MAAGLLHGDSTGALVARVDAKLLASGAPDAFAVTLEPTGGGSSPRGPVLLVGAISKG
jgi:anti-sigma-K factor RskA